jgi:hypothetical protein
MQLLQAKLLRMLSAINFYRFALSFSKLRMRLSWKTS